MNGSKHATVRLAEFTVPLIGIDPSATQMECEGCHVTVHLTEVTLTEDGQFLCAKCGKVIRSNVRPTSKK